jgi:hypothetical protein
MRLIFITLITFYSLSSFGQAFGIKMGYGFNNYSSDTLKIQNFNNQDTMSISIDNRGSTTYTSFFYRIPFEPFFIEIEPAISNYRIPIRIENIQDWNGGAITKYERFTTINLSLVLGVRVWETLRFQGGITSQYYFNLDSEMEPFSVNYSNDWEQYIQSWKVGAGIDLRRFSFEMNYENPFASIGNNINFFGQDYKFNLSRKRLEIKVSLALFDSFN